MSTCHASVYEDIQLGDIPEPMSARDVLSFKEDLRGKVNMTFNSNNHGNIVLGARLGAHGEIQWFTLDQQSDRNKPSAHIEFSRSEIDEILDHAVMFFLKERYKHKNIYHNPNFGDFMRRSFQRRFVFMIASAINLRARTKLCQLGQADWDKF